MICGSKIVNTDRIMKRFFIALLILSTSVTIMAQDNKWGDTPADSIKCWEDYNIFGSLIQTKAYEDAYDYWESVYNNCPQANKNIFIYAPRVLKAKIKEASGVLTSYNIDYSNTTILPDGSVQNTKSKSTVTVTDNQKVDLLAYNKYVDQLIESYDKRLEYFPGKEAYVTGEKASALMKYKKDVEGAYAAYTKAYELDSKLMSPAQVNGYFLSSVKMYNAKSVDLEKLMHVYLRCQEAIAQNRISLTKKINGYVAKEEASETLSKKEAKKKASAEKNLAAYQKVEGNIEKAISPLLSCSNLALLINQEKYDLNKDSKTWLSRAAKMLQKERTDDDGKTNDCTDNPLFVTIAERMLELEPSAGGYRAMAKNEYKKKSYTKAIEYYKKAVTLEEDPDVLFKDNLAIAQCYKYKGALSTAKNFTLKARAFNPNSGDTYLMLASIYADAAGDCGENVVEKNGVYWAAIDQCVKAKSVDPSVKSKADRLISAFKQGVPQKTIAFQMNYTEGQKIRLGCWINETVTIKFY